MKKTITPSFTKLTEGLLFHYIKVILLALSILNGTKPLALANSNFTNAYSYLPLINDKSWQQSTADVSKPIALLIPSTASTNVSISANLELEFNEPIYKGSGQIIVKYGSSSQTIDVGSNLVSIVNGNKVIINPADFPYGATIGVVVPSTAFRDGATNYFDGTTEHNWSFATINSTICSPLSILPCSAIPVNLPLNLSFDGNATGLKNTGFTMVDAPSARIAADGIPTYTTVPGYEPGKISLTGGQLVITSNKGIQYSQPTGSPSSSETNSQINALGVGFNGNTPVTLQTKLVRLDFSTSSGSNSQQAGVWFGLNENNYIKSAIVRDGTGDSGMIQLYIEQTNSSGSLIIGNNDGVYEFRSGSISNLSTKNVTLKLVLDPVARTAKAMYIVEGSAEIAVGTIQNVPAKFFAGADHDRNSVTNSISYGGVFATHRKATTPFPARFEDFTISTATSTANNPPVVVTAPQNQRVKTATSINFSAGSYADPDAGDGLTYRATLENGAAIPSWLQFNTSSLTFSGTSPNASGTYAIKITATDTKNASTSASFSLVVEASTTLTPCSPIST
ncbi:putative Ig domain-containing protein, partial [Rhodocytophaga aerolata]